MLKVYLSLFLGAKRLKHFFNAALIKKVVKDFLLDRSYFIVIVDRRVL